MHGVKAINTNVAWATGVLDLLLYTTDGHTCKISPRAADLQLPYPVECFNVDAVDATKAGKPEPDV